MWGCRRADCVIHLPTRYEWHHPIVLIGHSFGGLVLKSLVVKLNRESTIRNPINPWSRATVQGAKVFLGNVRGVAFYAVPHAGSSNIGKYVNKLLRCNNRHHPGIMDNIQPRQRDMEQLSVDFDRIVAENEINIYAFCEGRPMEQVEAREGDQALQEVHDLPESTFGLESYVERVGTLLTSEGKNADPRYVGVWGMGGVGKTLLLQRVYGSPKVHGHFQETKFIWRTVGQTPDIMALYRSLSEELGLKPELNANPEDYKLKLQSRFRRKRVFLVLDDVWQDKAFDSLDLAKGKGSVTLLSTRNQSLLKRASPPIKQEHMTPPSKEDSWSLFCVHAFRPPSNVPCELEALAQSMADECQGLPLALKVIGGAMFRKASWEWDSLLKKLRESRMYERPVEEELFERLKLGYALLSEDDWRLKQCFHYFAAFPEDYKIYFDRVLYHWIGEGLVPAHDGDDPRADAFSLLNKLLERSFIESPGEIGPSLIPMDNLLRFKVHDVMRDLAFYILEKDCGTPPGKQLYFYRGGQNLEEVPKECTAIPEALRLSLDTNKLEKLPESFHAPKLVSLLLGENRIVSLSATFFSNFPKLRVLDLSYGEFYSLPEELGDLKDLVCLDLSHCYNLEILPDTIGKLHMLKCLDLSECWKLNYLPCGVVGLTSLQVLHTYCSGIVWAKHTQSGMARETIGASLQDI
ncbi:unnamed protein product, partial [Sphagnum jensenii]